MKKVLYFFLLIFAFIVIYHFSLIRYGLGQAIGQLQIIYEAEPIEEYLNDPTVSDSIKSKLTFIEEVRTFAVDSLGLKNSKNYTTIYDQQGRPVLWVVTGSEPFAFKAKEWKFPVLGSVPYKGFFDLDKSTEEFQKVQTEGYDAGIRTVGGWSTLGWFRDPILSDMLNRSYGDLANLIIHELVHSTVFVKDSVEFNENLASFVGDKGAVAFMKARYGAGSKELQTYLDEQHDERLYIDHILRGVDSLERLYSDIEGQPFEKKLDLKNQMIEQIMATTDTLSLRNTNYLKFIKGQLPNNSYFMSFLRYRSKQEALDSLYKSEFNSKLKPFIRYLKNKYPYL